MKDARTIAMLARAVTSLDDAERLIEQYAKMRAATAVWEAVGDAYDHILATIEVPLTTQPPVLS